MVIAFGDANLPPREAGIKNAASALEEIDINKQG
jgi:hypothetical protein